MSLFRKKPVTIQAHQWFQHGDHPDDFSDNEKMVVRYYRDGADHEVCGVCSKPMLNHGWIETLEGGHRVCPGDWIITGVQGERYPCKPDIFALTYEPALSAED